MLRWDVRARMNDREARRGGVSTDLRSTATAALTALVVGCVAFACDDGGSDGDGKAKDSAAGYDIRYEDAGSFLPPKPSTAHCQPCNSTVQCDGADDAGAHCVDLGASGSFCGRPCEPACTQGYTCKDVNSIEGKAVKQCVPDKGECQCSAWSAAKALTTGCSKTSTFDGKTVSCPGVRMCTQTGLTACEAPAPAAETCDGHDNDCDGQTDESTCNDAPLCKAGACHPALGCTYAPAPGTCDDGDTCTKSDACNEGKCIGAAVICDDANPCTKDVCDKATGCSSKPTDGAVCSDNVACTKGEACALGKCTGGKEVKCDDGNKCTLDLCQKASGACINSATEDACDDGNPCTTGDACKDGACGSGAAKKCDDGLACTKDSCDTKSGCVALPADVTVCK